MEAHLDPSTLAEMRRKAKAATPGPWDVWSSLYEGMVAAVVQYVPDVPLRTVAEIRTNFADAQYIAAANPTFVTALLDRLERAEKALTDAAFAAGVTAIRLQTRVDANPDADGYAIGPSLMRTAIHDLNALAALARFTSPGEPGLGSQAAKVDGSSGGPR